MATMIFKYLKYRDNMFQDEGIILRATPRNNLNDPFEFLPPAILIEKISEIHKERKTSPPSYQQISQSFFSFHGAISFTESKSSLLMWSHYADEHRGIVLGFDKKHSFFKNLKRVKYDSIIPDEFIKDIDISDNDSLLKLFYLKSDEWIYEKEHRIIKDLIDSEYCIDNKENQLVKCLNNASTDWKHFFVVPYSALISIYFGCRMNNRDKKSVSEMLATKARNNSIKKYEAIQSSASFRLEFQKYETINESRTDTEQ